MSLKLLHYTCRPLSTKKPSKFPVCPARLLSAPLISLQLLTSLSAFDCYGLQQTPPSDWLSLILVGSLIDALGYPVISAGSYFGLAAAIVPDGRCSRYLSIADDLLPLSAVRAQPRIPPIPRPGTESDLPGPGLTPITQAGASKACTAREVNNPGQG